MKSYDYIQYRLSDVLREVTASTSNALASDTTVSIPYISYHSETWLELCNRLAAEAESDLSKETRFPLIALIGNDEYDIKDDSPYPEVSCTVIFVTKSDPTWRSEQRIAVNYNPILYPMYTEFMEQLVMSRYIQGPFNPYPTHKLIENYNVSEQGATGGTAYKLNDNCDGLIVTNLKLRLNRPRVAAFNYGPNAQVVYVNDIKHARITDIANTQRIQVELLSATYTDTLGVGYGASPVYQVYFDHSGSGLSISVGGSQTDSYATAHDGTYTGYVLCDDGQTRAILSFIYVISGGVLRRYTTDNYFLLNNISTNGSHYPNYDLNIIYQVKHLTDRIISASISTDGGNVIDDVNFTPSVDSTGTISKTFQLPKLSGYREILNSIGVEDTTLDSFSYYKII